VCFLRNINAIIEAFWKYQLAGWFGADATIFDFDMMVWMFGSVVQVEVLMN
jgi:hypothetical protein